MSDSGPSQPSQKQAYETANNPTDKSQAENSQAIRNANTDDDDAIAHRSAAQPLHASQAVPASSSRGVHGAPPGEETRGATQAGLDSQELDGEQMGAPGEGRVASAVQKQPGASGNERGLETDLDRKKAEQAPAREGLKEEKREGFDVAGVLGQRGGPAEAVGKGGYPNSGD